MYRVKLFVSSGKELREVTWCGAVIVNLIEEKKKNQTIYQAAVVIYIAIAMLKGNDDCSFQFTIWNMLSLTSTICWQETGTNVIA